MFRMQNNYKSYKNIFLSNIFGENVFLFLDKYLRSSVIFNYKIV